MKKTTVETLYTIGEVSKQLSVDQHVVRFWTSQFSQYVKPIRKAGQRRYYTKDDINMLHSIKKYLYERKISIKGVHIILAKKQNPNKISKKRVKPTIDNERITALLSNLQNKVRSVIDN